MKVISFCLWGNNSKYTVGAIINAELAKTIYPGWTCRYYIGDTVPADIIQKLSSLDNCEIVKTNTPGDWAGMYWRFLPASDEKVDVMISRDTDSRLNVKEKVAVDMWINSNFLFHIMRDHPYHGVPILGGMWGAKKGCVQNMAELIKNYSVGNFWQTDQYFLRDIIYPIVKDKAMVHDPFFEKKPFPIEDDGYFVGQVYESNGETNQNHLNMRKQIP